MIERPESTPEQIIDFWRTVEIFSPQKIEDLKPDDPENPTIDWSSGKELPWKNLPKPLNENKCWKHRVFLGVYRIESIYDTLHEMFSPDEDSYDQRPDGLSACAYIEVDKDGQIIKDSAVLSTSLWGIGEIRKNIRAKNYGFGGFDKLQTDFSDEILDLQGRWLRKSKKEKTPPLDEEALFDVLKVAHSFAGITSVISLATEGLRINSFLVDKDKGEDSQDSDFLNSFFLNDLNNVRSKVIENNFGKGLRDYLTPDSELETKNRIDVRTEYGSKMVDVRTGAKEIPLGRWPADPKHPLSLSQQFAVNTALQELGEAGGIMGVNGPPGTGKTTLLRDLLSANIVERAIQLANLQRPEHAFSGEKVTWKSGGYNRSVRRIISELRGYEMVVASTNNSAVENVSIELPDQKAINEIFFGQIDYFQDIATDILQSAKTENDSKAWAVISAKLGNSKNRADFWNNFWRPEKREEDVSPRGMFQTLDYANKYPKPLKWNEKKTKFKKAKEHLDALLLEREQAEQRIKDLKLVRDAYVVAKADYESTNLRKEHANRFRMSLHESMNQSDANVKLLSVQRERHCKARPGFIENLFSLFKALPAWREILNRLDAELRPAEQNLANLMQEYDRCSLYIQQVDNELMLLQIDCEKYLKRETDLNLKIVEDISKYNKLYPQADIQERELRSPWLDPELNKARSGLFLAALELHRAFIEGTPNLVYDLRAATEVVTGKAPRDLGSKDLLAAWQIFFMVVPLVSTSFASVDRMFPKLEHESIGWLLIDEAGQATPQSAVGAIWRFRKTLVIGDPLQLKPVITIPSRALYAIAGHYGVTEPWIPSMTSVQQLSDRVGVWGTKLKNGDWISAPLRVHRRCDSPMFDISNYIAYDGFMIPEVHRSSKDVEHFKKVPSSHWIDITSTEVGSNLQKDEIKKLHEKIKELINEYNIDPKDMIAIAPFRDIARELKKLNRMFPGIRGGTIHTAQGREADVVFLLLGGDPSKPGAKSWASSEPNLLNVAVSRAKRRLYVIGDRKKWSEYSNFDYLSLTLEKSAHCMPSCYSDDSF